MHQLFVAVAGDRQFVVPPDLVLPPGDLAVVTPEGNRHDVDPAALAGFEVDRAAAIAHLADGTAADLVDRGAEFVRLLGATDSGTAAAHDALTSLADATSTAMRAALAADGTGTEFGRTVDGLAAALERAVAERRRATYRAGADAAIAASLRSAGITPSADLDVSGPAPSGPGCPA